MPCYQIDENAIVCDLTEKRTVFPIRRMWCKKCKRFTVHDRELITAPYDVFIDHRCRICDNDETTTLGRKLSLRQINKLEV